MRREPWGLCWKPGLCSKKKEQASLTHILLCSATVVPPVGLLTAQDFQMLSFQVGGFIFPSVERIIHIHLQAPPQVISAVQLSFICEVICHMLGRT